MKSLVITGLILTSSSFAFADCRAALETRASRLEASIIADENDYIKHGIDHSTAVTLVYMSRTELRQVRQDLKVVTKAMAGHALSAVDRARVQKVCK